jgi:glycosyltransferase involved in cell wall biosynthesis
MGFAAACNNAVLMASSPWAAFLDGQDAWHPEKIARQAAFHAKNPSVAISCTDEVRSGETAKPQKQGVHSFIACLTQCGIPFSSVIAKKKTLEEVGLFDETLPLCADFDLWLRLLEEREIGYVDQQLAITQDRPEEGKELWCARALEKHLDGPHEESVRLELIHRYEKLLETAHAKNAPEEEGIYAARLQQLRMGTD